MEDYENLVRDAAQCNPELARRIEAICGNKMRQTFGLNFNRRLPEDTEVPSKPVRKGSIVHVLPERGSKGRKDDRNWQVVNVSKNADGERVGTLVEQDVEPGADPEILTDVPVSDMVSVSGKDDLIYPGLKMVDEIIADDSVDAPFHSVINAENLDALKALAFTHYHSIDCIYIDPPYNTGAKNWKYNNNYVDSTDSYRDSKWLSFMEKRLKLAKLLLNPDDSALIVTIDEKEIFELGVLLKQIFPEARIQMISSVINRAASSRQNEFGRVNEYILIVQFGHSKPTPLPLTEDWYINGKKDTYKKLRWDSLVRTGSSPYREDSPGCFYPIFVYNTPDGPQFHSVGDTVPEGESKDSVTVPEGCVALWPMRSNGREGRYQMTPESLREIITQGYVRLGKWREEKTSVMYVARGNIERIEDGVYKIIGHAQDGSIITDDGADVPMIPSNQWNIPSHDATHCGTRLISALFGESKRFTFPKSLYAVEDVLRFMVKNKPHATILDFFAGSGTTAHAVMRLNQEDGGHRTSISVTNNEISHREEVELTAEGFRPGDKQWDELGIATHVTYPRIKAAITGNTAESGFTEPINGKYRYNMQHDMSDGIKANARFFNLTYESPDYIKYGLSLKKILPLIWMRSGQSGRMITEIPDKGFDVSETYAVVHNAKNTDSLLEEISKNPGVRTVFIISDDNYDFQRLAQPLLKMGVDPVKMYSTYLNTFNRQG